MDLSADDSGGMSRAVGAVWPVAVGQGFGEDSRFGCCSCGVGGAVLQNANPPIVIRCTYRFCTSWQDCSCEPCPRTAAVHAPYVRSRFDKPEDTREFATHANVERKLKDERGGAVEK